MQERNPESTPNQQYNSSTGLIVAVQSPEQSDADVEASCVEMEKLAATLGIQVVEQVVQKRQAPSSATYVGRGKLAEIASLIEEKSVETVLVDDDLRPRQHRTLQRELGVAVRDRTDIILEIFEYRAGTKQAQLEVEIARLRYELPRLRDDDSYEGRRGGGGRGERGHTNVELGKQRIRDRIAELKDTLERAQQVDEARRERRDDAYRVALVGYTNAGKSTLMEGLTDCAAGVEDKLFATLGTRVRRLQPPTSPPVVISDTVGFIRNLPHQLVASFRSTLAEAAEANLILVVVDASDPDWIDQLRVTLDTLESIGASDVTRQIVLNKVDRLDEQTRQEIVAQYGDALSVSALHGDDLDLLREEVLRFRDLGLCEETLVIPFDEGQVVGEVYERAHVVDETHSAQGTILHFRAYAQDIDRWRQQFRCHGLASSREEVLEAASRHGLHLACDGDDVIDEGLDFRVWKVEDEDRRPWILRAPRRQDVFLASRVEGRALRLLRKVLAVEIPHWKIHCPQLIAYPMIEGRRGWSVDIEGNMSWGAIEPGDLSKANAESIAKMLAELQSLDAAKVAAAGLPTHDIDEVRRTYRRWVEVAKEPLGASASVVERWQRWLDSDANWPTHTALVHGDFHPGHMLFNEDGGLRGVLDWTEAKLWDPAEDLLIFYACFGDEAFGDVVDHFAAFGGKVWPGIYDHVREGWFFYPVKVAAWAIKHDDDSVMEHARMHLSQLLE